MILLLDNYDSFTYNLVDYFGQLGRECRVFRNDEDFNKIINGDYESLVISPGPEIPRKAGHLMQILDHFAGRVPVLGICLGHQAIGEYFGADLIRAEKPMHGKVCRIKVDNSDILFRGLPAEFSVVRYNSLILDRLPTDLVVTARAANDEIMALRHNELMIHGVQFHPEAILTDFGIQMLQNWVECYSMTV